MKKYVRVWWVLSSLDFARDPERAQRVEGLRHPAVLPGPTRKAGAGAAPDYRRRRLRAAGGPGSAPPTTLLGRRL